MPRKILPIFMPMLFSFTKITHLLIHYELPDICNGDGKWMVGICDDLVMVERNLVPLQSVLMG
jgi:hypothetical protein